MDADGAYLELINTVLESAKFIGIPRPSERLWTYQEQQAVFSHLGVELCAVGASSAFRSGCRRYGSVIIIVFNANMKRSHQLAEIYRHLTEHLAREIYQEECARDPMWARHAARRAVRHWLRNLRPLTREADQDEVSEPTLSLF